MITKHFFKILIIFIVMILLGIAGVFWSSSVDDSQSLLNVLNIKDKNNTAQVKN